jgi:hypothetical protein
VNLYHYTALIVLAMLMPTEVQAQSRTFYGADAARPQAATRRRSTAAMGAASALSRQPNHRADDHDGAGHPHPTA